jgi:hypothetical protein
LNYRGAKAAIDDRPAACFSQVKAPTIVPLLATEKDQGESIKSHGGGEKASLVFDFHHLEATLCENWRERWRGGNPAPTTAFVAEMLASFDELAEAFRWSLLNYSSEDDDDAWMLNTASLGMNKLHARRRKVFRPIVVLSVLCNFYSRLLLHLTQGSLFRFKAP